MPAEHPPTSWPDASPVSLPARHDQTPTCSAPPIPQGPCPVCPRLAQEFEPWRQAAYWQAMHQRAVQRETLLQQENEQLHARIRFLEQQLFGRKAELPATADGPARRDPIATAPRATTRQARTPTPRLLPPARRRTGPRTARRTAALCRLRTAVRSRSPAPTTPPSWRSRSRPIGGSTADDAIAPPAPVALTPASSPHRRPPK